MYAVLYSLANHRRVYGQVIQRGIGKITLIVIDKKGSSAIKQFSESKWAVHLDKKEGLK